MKIGDILVRGLKTIPHKASMADAEKMLKEHNIRHLPVSNGKDIVGIISDRDIERASTLIKSEDKTEKHIQEYKKVTDYMTAPVLKMKTSDTVEALTREMVRHKVSSYIIVDENFHPVGIMTTEDLLLLLLEKLEKANPFNVIKRIVKGYLS